MPRKQPKHIQKEVREDYTKGFAKVVASLESPEQVERFFTDLLSDTEMLMLSRRLRIATLLLEGHSYSAITDLLGASTGTIAQVHHWLQKDNDDLPRLQRQLTPFIKKSAKQTKAKPKEYAAPGTMAWMQQRYPVHFLLFNLFSRE